MSKVQIEMEIKKVLQLMNLTLDNDEWVNLHCQYLLLKEMQENC